MQTIKTGPRDVFGNILAMLGLYVSVFFFGSLLFSLIDVYFPEVSAYGHYGSVDLIWPLAILIIVFPLYVWISWYIAREIEQNPEKRELRTRKWLLYFTLFVAALIVIGDLVTLIYTYLNGEIITLRFALKIFAVLVIASIVLLYYSWNLRSGTPISKDPTKKWFVYGVLAIAFASILLGFYTSDSPATKRAKRFDERRTADLSGLQYQIANFWQSKERLPQSLDELRNEFIGYIPPVDPQTNNPYSYAVTGKMSFELCATFNRSNKNENEEANYPEPIYKPRGFEDVWIHGEGENCFARTIDPDLFPPFNKRM